MNDDNVFLAVVIGRNRRVYARTYKRNNSYITKMANHYKQMEVQKSACEGFRVVGMTDESPNENMRIFRIQYADV